LNLFSLKWADLDDLRTLHAITYTDAMLCCAMLCCAALCCAVLCCHPQQMLEFLRHPHLPLASAALSFWATIVLCCADFTPAMLCCAVLL
jgi:hypothetical protein